VRSPDARAAALIRIHAVWLATTPMDMRDGTESSQACVIQVFGSAKPRHQA